MHVSRDFFMTGWRMRDDSYAWTGTLNAQSKKANAAGLPVMGAMAKTTRTILILRSRARNGNSPHGLSASHPGLASEMLNVTHSNIRGQALPDLAQPIFILERHDKALEFRPSDRRHAVTALAQHILHLPDKRTLQDTITDREQ